jgi:hypothetical protein
MLAFQSSVHFLLFHPTISSLDEAAAPGGSLRAESAHNVHHSEDKEEGKENKKTDVSKPYNNRRGMKSFARRPSPSQAAFDEES